MAKIPANKVQVGDVLISPVAGKIVKVSEVDNLTVVRFAGLGKTDYIATSRRVKVLDKRSQV